MAYWTGADGQCDVHDTAPLEAVQPGRLETMDFLLPEVEPWSCAQSWVDCPRLSLPADQPPFDFGVDSATHADGVQMMPFLQSPSYHTPGATSVANAPQQGDLDMSFAFASNSPSTGTGREASGRTKHDEHTALDLASHSSSAGATAPSADAGQDTSNFSRELSAGPKTTNVATSSTIMTAKQAQQERRKEKNRQRKRDSRARKRALKLAELRDKVKDPEKFEVSPRCLRVQWRESTADAILPPHTAVDLPTFGGTTSLSWHWRCFPFVPMASFHIIGQTSPPALLLPGTSRASCFATPWAYWPLRTQKFGRGSLVPRCSSTWWTCSRLARKVTGFDLLL
jgi:hypothetical protein